jgi:hypothetical protein
LTLSLFDMNSTENPVNAEDVDDIYSLKAKITKQQSFVKQLKKDGADALVINGEVAVLLDLRSKLAQFEKASVVEYPFNRKSFDELLLRKMFVVPAFEIHNGPAGLFDYGPPCSALKANVITLWRQHFVYEESMLEMECTNLTPASVLQTSGHVERFTDFMVRDVVTGECFRADKLLEDVIDKYLLAHPELSSDEADEHRIIQVTLSSPHSYQHPTTMMITYNDYHKTRDDSKFELFNPESNFFFLYTLYFSVHGFSLSPSAFSVKPMHSPKKNWAIC